MSDDRIIAWSHELSTCPEPGHAPDYELVDCPGFPTVEDRVAHMDRVLEVCWSNEPVTPEDRVVDMLADLLHYTDANDIDFHAALLRAEDHHAEERADAAPWEEPLPPPTGFFAPGAAGLRIHERALGSPRVSHAGTCSRCGSEKVFAYLGQHQRWCKGPAAPKQIRPPKPAPTPRPPKPPREPPPSKSVPGTCGVCGRAYLVYGKHLRHNPTCRPAAPDARECPPSEVKP